MKKYTKTYNVFLLPIFFFLSQGAFASGVDGLKKNPAGTSSQNIGSMTQLSYVLNVGMNSNTDEQKENIHQKSMANTPIIILLLVSSAIIIIHLLRKIRSSYFAKLNYLKSDNEKLKIEISKLKIEYVKLFSHLNHEFNNALNSIQSASSLFFEHYQALNEEEKNTLMTSISSSTKMLGKYVDTLSTWAQVETDVENAEPVVFKILPIVVEEVSKLEELIDNKKVEVILDINEESFAFMDEAMFHIIIGSLVSNGIKYSNNGAKVIVHAANTDKHAVISVQDFGTGISKKNLANMFDMKTVFNTIGPNGEKGIGLSLIICKKYIEAAKGKIIVETSENKGSLITITIPKNNISI